MSRRRVKKLSSYSGCDPDHISIVASCSHKPRQLSAAALECGLWHPTGKPFRDFAQPCQFGWCSGAVARVVSSPAMHTAPRRASPPRSPSAAPLGATLLARWVRTIAARLGMRQSGMFLRRWRISRQHLTLLQILKSWLSFRIRRTL